MKTVNLNNRVLPRILAFGGCKIIDVDEYKQCVYKKTMNNLQKLAIIMSLFMTLGANACNNTTVPTDKVNTVDGDTLIVYFSRAGENYGVGTVSVGNTAMMAGYIQEITGGTIFEIVPVVPYPSSYEETKLISQKEHDENLRPAIKNKLDSLSKYSVVFIGSPIWYGGAPMIVETFYETYPELKDKVLIPFGTHEGSGINSLTQVLKRHFPKADIKETFGLTGREVRNSPAKSHQAVKNWIGRIEISK